MNAVVAEHLRLKHTDCAPRTSAVHVGISGRHRQPVTVVWPTARGVLVRFVGDGTLRHVHPTDLARDPRPAITTHSTVSISNAVVEVETYEQPATLTEPARPAIHGVAVESREVLDLEQAREMRDALICAVRELERLQGH